MHNFLGNMASDGHGRMFLTVKRGLLNFCSDDDDLGFKDEKRVWIQQKVNKSCHGWRRVANKGTRRDRVIRCAHGGGGHAW